MDFHDISSSANDYVKLITRNISINRKELRNVKQMCYAKIKKDFFSLKYEHVILEDKIGELALLIACTKLAEKELNLKDGAFIGEILESSSEKPAKKPIHHISQHKPAPFYPVHPVLHDLVHHGGVNLHDQHFQGDHRLSPLPGHVLRQQPPHDGVHLRDQHLQGDQRLFQLPEYVLKQPHVLDSVYLRDQHLRDHSSRHDE